MISVFVLFFSTFITRTSRIRYNTSKHNFHMIF